MASHQRYTNVQGGAEVFSLIILSQTVLKRAGSHHNGERTHQAHVYHGESLVLKDHTTFVSSFFPQLCKSGDEMKNVFLMFTCVQLSDNTQDKYTV